MVGPILRSSTVAMAYRKRVNIVLLRRNTRFFSFDLKNFYPQTPMDWSEYVRIKLLDIPQEFIKEYDLTEAAQNVWI